MVRVPTYASYMNLTNQTLGIKSKLDLYNFQTITGLKSPTYSGYGMSAYNIVSMEGSLSVLNNFMENNTILNTELSTMNTSTSAISKAIKDFKSSLLSFSGMDLSNINPDYTGGEITLGSAAPTDYLGQTLTVDGVKYTFVDDTTAGTTGNTEINIQAIIDDAGTHTQDENNTAVANALKNALPANPDYKFEDNKFSFPLYTINGSSSLLNVNGVTTGEPHLMSDEQSQTMKQLQEEAFSSMKIMIDSLNTFANGKYMFGGGVSDHAPVNFPFNTLEEFQNYFNGDSIKYPSNAAANLSNWSFNSSQTGNLTLELTGNGNEGTITAANTGAFIKSNITAGATTTGDLTFNSDKNTITATEYGAFNTLNAGDTMIIGGADAGGNAKAYVIKSISADGKTITVEDSTSIVADGTVVNGGDITFGASFPVGSVINMDGFGNNISPQVQVTGISADGTQLIVSVDPSRFPPNGAPQTIPASSKWSMESTSYYTGGNLDSQQRISNEQSITMNINAGDPAFEKLFRALGEIAQGNLTTSLDPKDTFDGLIDFTTTSDRVENAIDLINDGIFSGGKTTTKSNSDLYSVQAQIDANMVILKQNDDNQKLVKKTLEDNIGSLKDVDKTEAAIKALLASTNLQASYSVLQQAMSISLINYL